MELSEEFILELTQSQQRLFGFLFKRLADRDREVLQRTNLVLGRKSKAALAADKFLEPDEDEFPTNLA